MARETGREITIGLVYEGIATDEARPKTVLIAQDDKRKEILRVKFDEGDKARLPTDVFKKAVRLVVGPAEQTDRQVPDTNGNLLVYQRDAFDRLVKRGTIEVSSRIWKSWLHRLRCVSGRVRVCRRSPWWFRDLVDLAVHPQVASNPGGPASCLATTEERPQLATATKAPARLSPAASLDHIIAWPFRCFPVCNGRIEVWRRVCCCKPWVVFDPRIPELIRDLEYLVRRIPQDLGPLPEPGPDPSIRAAAAVLFREGALDEKSLRAAQDLMALRALGPEQIPDYVNARPYLFCRSYNCGNPVKVAEGDLGAGGIFNVCWFSYAYLTPSGCHEEFAYVVRQPFGPFSLTIYNGVAAGQWYHRGDNPTLTSYSSLAYGCRNNPDGNFVFLDLIGDTGAHELITPAAVGATSVASPAYNSGLVFPAPNPAAAEGAALNRNWGGTLKLSFMFSEGMQDVGAKFYRISIVEADGAGNPTGTRHYYDAGLSWNKAVPDGGGGVSIVPVSLGPTTAGAGADEQNFLYVIPYDTNPTTDWNAGQYHAHIDTRDARWSDPDMRHLIMLEVFDENGRRLRPDGAPATGLGGQEATAAFSYRRRYQETGATANVPFGALTHMFWWDNRDVFADIVDLRRNGLVYNSECLFFGGAETTTFSVGYHAYHPRQQFQLYHRIWWRRGLGSTPGSSGVLQPLSSVNVGQPPAAPGGSATNSFADMLRPDLDPARRRCAFTAFLDVWNKRTDGDDLGFQRDGDTAAFVIEIDA